MHILKFKQDRTFKYSRFHYWFLCQKGGILHVFYLSNRKKKTKKNKKNKKKQTFSYIFISRLNKKTIFRDILISRFFLLRPQNREIFMQWSRNKFCNLISLSSSDVGSDSEKNWIQWILFHGLFHAIQLFSWITSNPFGLICSQCISIGSARYWTLLA